MDLQELIVRGKHLFENAPARLESFKLVNGRRTTVEIAETLGRPVNAVRRDVRTMINSELIQEKTGADGVRYVGPAFRFLRELHWQRQYR